MRDASWHLLSLNFQVPFERSAPEAQLTAQLQKASEFILVFWLVDLAFYLILHSLGRAF